MKEIVLHGSLGARFGERFFLDVRDPAEALRALGVQIAGFREAIAQGNWHLVRGPLDSGTEVKECDATLALGADHELHIVPAAEGAGSGFWSVVTFGLGSWLMGKVMSPKTAADDAASRERPDQRPSFFFDGPVNTSTQGLPVPIICGRVKCGSVVVSAGMTAEQI